MQLEEQGVEAGLIGPWKRILILGLSTYAAAIASNTVVEIFDGDLRFDFARLPIIEAFEHPWSVIHVPVLGFCVFCSAVDRSTTWQITALGVGSTFFYHLLAEIWFKLPSAIGIPLFALLEGMIVYLVFFHQWTRNAEQAEDGDTSQRPC